MPVPPPVTTATFPAKLFMTRPFPSRGGAAVRAPRRHGMMRRGGRSWMAAESQSELMARIDGPDGERSGARATSRRLRKMMDEMIAAPERRSAEDRRDPRGGAALRAGRDGRHPGARSTGSASGAGVSARRRLGRRQPEVAPQARAALRRGRLPRRERRLPARARGAVPRRRSTTACSPCAGPPQNVARYGGDPKRLADRRRLRRREPDGRGRPRTSRAIRARRKIRAALLIYGVFDFAAFELAGPARARPRTRRRPQAARRDGRRAISARSETPTW